MKFLGMTIMTTPLNHEIPMKIPMKSSWTEQKRHVKNTQKTAGSAGSVDRVQVAVAVILIIPHQESSYIIGSTLW